MKVSRPGQGTANKWRYVQPESGAVFNAFSYWELEEKIAKHRQAMGYDLAEGWKDRFQHDLCSQNAEAPCTDRPNVKKEKITLKDLKRFINSMAQWDGKFVAQEEADRRAEICSTCPKNQHIPGCRTCAGVLTLAKKYLLDRKTQRDAALESCGICKCFNAVAVHFPLESQDTTGLEFPEWCWKRLNE